MIKSITSFVAVSLITTSGFAQGFYFRAGLGYSFAQAGQSMYDTPTPYNGFPTGYNGTRSNTANTQTYNIRNASFSAGFQGALGIGYMVNKHVGVQLDAGIGLASKTYTFNDNNFNSGGVVFNMNTSMQAKNPILLMPSLVLQSGDANDLNIYARIGLALPLNANITQDQVISNAPGTGLLTVDDFTWQLKTRFSLGFAAAAGVKYRLNDRVSLWGEISMLSMSLNVKEQNLQAWSENGQSVPLSNYGYAQNIKYTKTATLDSNFAELPSYSVPFSNIGINVGIITNLSHNSGHRGKGTDGDNDDLIDRPKRTRFK